MATTKVRAKSHHEAFAQFFETPSREGLRRLLQEHHGETANLDFKESWPGYNEVARHVLGLGNSGGGCLLVGVAENEQKELVANGLTSVPDKNDIYKGIQKYLPESLLGNLEVLEFSYADSEYPTLKGKRFQVLIVTPDLLQTPFLAKRGTTGIKDNTVYVRRGAATEEANYEELQRIVDARLNSERAEASHVPLKEHLVQLKVLMNEAPNPATVLKPKGLGLLRIGAWLRDAEDYDAFITRMIKMKKLRIERIVQTGVE